MLVACVMLEAYAANVYTWTGPATWSNYVPWDADGGAFWSGGDGSDPSSPMPGEGADLVFDSSAQTGSLGLRLPTAADYPSRFASIRHVGVSGKTFSFQNGEGGNRTSFALGAGGLAATQAFPGIGFAGLWELTASQVWRADAATAGNISSWSCSFAADSDVEWTINGPQAVFFNAGNADRFLGKVTSNAALWLCHTNQFGRLGANRLTLTGELATSALSPVPELVFAYLPGDGGVAECPTPLALDLRRTGTHVNHERPYLGIYLYDGTQDVDVRLTGGLSGVVADGCLQLGQTGGQMYSDIQWDHRYPGVYRTRQCRLTLAGDGSGLVPATSGGRVYVSTVVALEHPDALGAGNGAFAVSVGDPNVNGMNNRHAPYLAGVLGRRGVTIASPIHMRNNSDQKAGRGRSYVALLGADDASDVRYVGDITAGNLRAWADAGMPTYRFTAAKGGSARFEGYVHAQFQTQVLGLGDVAFTCETNRFYRPIAVRGGRLVLANARALAQTATDDATRQTPQTVILGDVVPASREVDLFFAGVWTKSADGVGDIVMDATDGAHANNRLTFTRAPAAIDGVAVKKGDVIAVNSMWTCLKGADVYANGVWEVTDDDCRVWRRVDWLDDVAEVVAGHGMRIHVRSGAQFGGQAFFLANTDDEADETAPFAFGTMPLTFHDEAEAQPNVGFMIDGAWTCNNPVVVTDNRSTGVSELGGTTADESVFAGGITNQKGRVTFSAVAGGTVRVTGDLVAAEGVEAVYAKTGAGTVDLTEAKNFTADGLEISGGTLKV